MNHEDSLVNSWQEYAAANVVHSSWLDALSDVGPVAVTRSSVGDKLYSMLQEYSNNDWALRGCFWGDLARWPGAGEHACQVELDDGQGAWLRYLNDHATKSKQAQIATGYGRHWGIIGKARLPTSEAAETLDLTPDQSARFWRAFDRLRTPQIKDERALFGRRLGTTPKRGRWGRAVFFSRPDTVRKLAEWAMSDAAQHCATPCRTVETLAKRSGLSVDEFKARAAETRRHASKLYAA